MFKIPRQITVSYKMVVDTAEYPDVFKEGMTKQDFLSKAGDIGENILESSGLHIEVVECDDSPQLVGEYCLISE